jgi:hypothetical protein
MNLELFSRDVEAFRASTGELRASVERLYATVEQDSENIRALARIAEIHERRLTSLENPEQQ